MRAQLRELRVVLRLRLRAQLLRELRSRLLDDLPKQARLGKCYASHELPGTPPSTLQKRRLGIKTRQAAQKHPEQYRRGRAEGNRPDVPGGL